MELVTATTSLPLPAPKVPIVIRPGTMEDIPFMDALQKKTTKQVGWMPTKQFEGKIALGHVLIAVASDQWPVVSERRGESEPAPSLATDHRPLTTPCLVGYLIGNDQYFKRDDVGIVYQINVVPEYRRSFVGAALLRAQFERSAYGCMLYCCWCAQDIEANRFWESMGFSAIAFRTGSPTKGAKKSPRIHIFWQKRIRAGDATTPFWFPAKTGGGSIRDDRLVLPIPGGMSWRDEMPVVLAETASDEVRALPHPSSPRAVRRKPDFVEKRAPREIPRMSASRLQFFGAMPSAEPVAPAKAKPERAKRVKAKHDPQQVAMARELRDRWMERQADVVPAIEGKYDVARDVQALPHAIESTQGQSTNLLAA